MSEPVQATSTNLFRVGMPGGYAFQLRPGEEGLSVFAEDGVDPLLTETEVLASFRTDSIIRTRSQHETMVAGLEVVAVEGTDNLPDRLRQSHRELRPGQGMTRAQFKQALRRLE